MVKISGEYKGQLHCTITHGPSSSTIYTDAPKDNAGMGEAFSPTDLVAGALGSCIATVLGIYSRRKGWSFDGLRFEVVKEMMDAPERRIGRLCVQIWMPINLSNEDRQACERVAMTCPVHRSLHPGIEISTTFHWPSKK